MANKLPEIFQARGHCHWKRLSQMMSLRLLVFKLISGTIIPPPSATPLLAGSLQGASMRT